MKRQILLVPMIALSGLMLGGCDSGKALCDNLRFHAYELAVIGNNRCLKETPEEQGACLSESTNDILQIVAIIREAHQKCLEGEREEMEEPIMKLRDLVSRHGARGVS